MHKEYRLILKYNLKTNKNILMTVALDSVLSNNEMLEHKNNTIITNYVQLFYKLNQVCSWLDI